MELFIIVVMEKVRLRVQTVPASDPSARVMVRCSMLLDGLCGMPSITTASGLRWRARMSAFFVRSFRKVSLIMSDEVILIENLIHEFRGKKVMLDYDLARLYHVTTGALNQAVQRNIKRFPSDFMFQLDSKEFTNLKSQIVTSSWGGTRKLPYAFTEQGIAMLSGVLKSDIAIAANIAIMRAFVQVREYLLAASSVSTELKELRARVDLLQNQYEDNRDAINTLCDAIALLADRLEEKKNEPRPKIGF